MRIICVIPARMGSSRFPGKPLIPILGRPMIEHVYQRARLWPELSDVVVATCDREIMDAVEAFGGRALMTAPTHERATDRVAEAARSLDADVIIMLQGDEPMVRPEMLAQSSGPFLGEPSLVCTNLGGRIRTLEEFHDPNTIKVVVDGRGNALYFSRQPIPTVTRQDFSAVKAVKQVCVITYRADMLQEYSRMEPTPLEISESVDMMRFLEHGHPVRIVPTEHESYAVDVPADVARVEAALQADNLLQAYT